MKKLSWKAILGGIAVDIVGGMMLGIVIVIPFLVQSARSGNFAPNFAASSTFLILSAFLGLFMDVLGGYLAALWAPNQKVIHAVIVGFGSLAFGSLIHLSDKTPYPLWFSLTWLLVVPCAALGGWWRVRTHGPESKPKIETPSTNPPIASPFGD